MNFNFLTPFNWIKFTQQRTCQNIRSEWYLAKSDVGGRNIARKDICKGLTFQILKHP